MSNDKSRPLSPGEAENSQGDHSHRSLIRSTSILSLGTLTSRIFGFVRDVILARILGTGMWADVFFVAFRIPNLFRDLIGEGAANAAIIPVFSEYRVKQDKQSFHNFVNVVCALGLILLSTITVLGIIFAPLIVRLIAPGFMEDPDKLDMTVKLTRLMYPYLVFVGLTAYCMAVLNTYQSFVVPAFSPALLNICLILSAFFTTNDPKETVFVLALGVLSGGVLQLAVHIRPMLRTGIKFRWPQQLRHSGAKKIGQLLVPRLFGSGVYQLSVLIDTLCASLASIVGPGGISAIYYSNRIIQLPMGIFSVALASAALPTLSSHASKNDAKALRKTLLFTLENILFIMAPTTVITILLATPTIRVLFERGEFDVYSTHITATALFYYAFGLFSYGGTKILVTAFYSMHDTKTPVKVAAICLAFNALLNFILMYPLKVGGIALASSIAGTVNFLTLLYLMDKKVGGLIKDFYAYALKVGWAACITGAVIYLSWRIIPVQNELVKLLIWIAAGLVIFEVVAILMHIEQAKKIGDWLKKGLIFSNGT